MDSPVISVEEVAKILGKSRHFVINAVVNGSLPGCYTISPGGRRNVSIPRKAFEKFMEAWDRSPDEEVIDALIKAYVNKNSRHGNVD
ncbi:hypothetical protein B5E92_04240 [Erysipelatoclostridium sp. An15]|uniref:helix-turn-helix domain-containing protein n=1 Tax=Erysipelatoclostridium sp. An15 TaxID=1965566 RepID=UPI000B3A5CC2|nr:helix-turn-helix domain-containing protein [Erysipelatoclostridium sp. An15]OUQ08268.1 hypothetical protein B5E92_04240 [Erysipelatoclostridium sp. An15]